MVTKPQKGTWAFDPLPNHETIMKKKKVALWSSWIGCAWHLLGRRDGMVWPGRVKFLGLRCFDDRWFLDDVDGF